MRHSFFITVFLLSCLVIAVYGCTNKSTTDARATSTTIPSTAYTISSQVIATSIQQLTHYADIVAIGRIVSKEKVVNSARDPSDPTKPDTQYYSINRVYKVEVEQVIKGEKLQSLLLAQYQGSLPLTSGKEPSTAEIESEIQRNEQKTFIPLSFEKHYLFFIRILDKLNYDMNGYSSSDLYGGVLIEPWLFEITDTGMVVPETLLSRPEEFFPPLALNAFLEAISQPYVPGQIPNPYPGAPIEDDQMQTPYP